MSSFKVTQGHIQSFDFLKNDERDPLRLHFSASDLDNENLSLVRQDACACSLEKNGFIFTFQNQNKLESFLEVCNALKQFKKVRGNYVQKENMAYFEPTDHV